MMRIRAAKHLSRPTKEKANEMLDFFDRAVKDILKTAQNQGYSFEELYRYCYHLVEHGYGEKLFRNLKKAFFEHTTSLKEQIDSSSKILQTISSLWESYITALEGIREISSYLFRVYEKSFVVMVPGLLPLNDMAAEAFRKEVLEKDGIGEMVRKEALEMVKMDREGAQINSEPIKTAGKMWISMGRQIYEEHFEKFLLEETTAHYRSLSEKLVSANSPANYLAKLQVSKKSEGSRMIEYFEMETIEKVSEVMKNVFIATLIARKPQ